MSKPAMPKPFAWMTAESAQRLAQGGNVKGAVPVHGTPSAAAKIGLYRAPQAARARELERRAACFDSLLAALQRIARWQGEFPETGRFWSSDPSRQMSYGAVNGSNGERDYMRQVARDAIAAATQGAPK